ncbi:ATP-binding protein [Streptomyces turgidiscabies]|uniref:Anti-sigma regulatory factor (Ser/Thr protein kinase) n=1 Tax=Streptomyces turgidiscabies TaxID=85558 RepID=A0ABU0RT58_9ACTN|nr:ATP-binding protein [Streptomyces turgidiscabies]MDQ0935182.1 anti-sigma regulatory factor (Ser/Thr protein kinase) [Streptomyces turgidiscabies]
MTPRRDETFLTPSASAAAGSRRRRTFFLGEPLASTPNLAVRSGLGPTPFTAHRIPASTNCLYVARKFTREAVLRWNLDSICDDAVQIASELVANAVRHGQVRTTTPDHEEAAVWLALALRPHSLLCAVRDPSQRRPRLTPPPPLAERHRGLPIIDALSNTWGWTTHTQTRGKTVWARVNLPAA